MISEAPNINHLWARLIVEELVRNGVTQFFIAPGSRSTPLVTAIAGNPRASAIVHFDERGTAFAALGYGRVTGKPAAWVTTSGTAVANGMPVVVEASIDTVPLLLLTADRPPELRATGANQTIKQPGIFGDYIRWAFDGPAPNAHIPGAFVLTTVDQAVHRCAGGPVHLNWMFREPLAPEKDASITPDYLAEIAGWEADDLPFTTYPPVRKVIDPVALDRVCDILEGASRGVIVAGRMDDPGLGKAVLACAEYLGWPLLADLGSQVKLGYRSHPGVICHYDAMLAHDTFRTPDVILQFGRRSTSKILLAWMAAAPAQHIVVDPLPDRLDPGHGTGLRVEADIAWFCQALAGRLEPNDEVTGEWLLHWQKAEKKVAKKMDGVLRAGSLSEPKVARVLSEMLPAGHALVVANSMPVRDMDAFGQSPAPVRVCMNRGASGIDGIVATAAGVATGLDQPVTLFTGDLSLLHDLNSLALLRHLPHPAVIVVVNNDGGGIFSFLPISSYNEVFERFFAASHGLNFKSSAEMFGLTYHAPEDVTSFQAAYAYAVRSKVSTLIELKTDRGANLAVHRAIEKSLKLDE